MTNDPYLGLRRRVQRRMESRLALPAGETSVDRSLRQIELAKNLPAGITKRDPDELLYTLHEEFSAALIAERVRLSVFEQTRMFNLIVGDLLGLGALESLLEEPGVGAAFVLGTNAIFVERGGRLLPTGVTFDDADQLNKIIRRVFEPRGYWIGEGTALAATHWRDGERVDALLSPDLSPDGVQLVVRKPDPDIATFDALVDGEMLPAEVADFLRACVLIRRTMLIAGDRRSGKSLLLAALSDALPHTARLVVVEDAREMPIEHRHTVRLEAAPQHGPEYGIDSVLRHAPAFLPDWIWLGEVTADNAIAYADTLARANLCATLTTRSKHRSTARHALDHIVALALENQAGVNGDAIQRQLFAGIDVLVYTQNDIHGLPIVGEVLLVEADGALRSIYRAEVGPDDALSEAIHTMTPDADLYGNKRSQPTDTHTFAAPFFASDGRPTDDTLDEAHMVEGGLVIGLREVEGALVGAHSEQPGIEANRVAEVLGQQGTLMAVGSAPDGARLALAREPVSTNGPSITADVFAAGASELKQFAMLGMLSSESGNLLVEAAMNTAGILVCGPAGSGKRALMNGLLAMQPEGRSIAHVHLLEMPDAQQVLAVAPEWVHIASVDAGNRAVLLDIAGEVGVLAGLDCADGANPFSALSNAHTVTTNEQSSPMQFALGFEWVVRMSRVANRQRMVVNIERVVLEGDAVRLEAAFVARPGTDGNLTLVQV